MDSFTATNKILENLKLKYRYMDNIMNLTKDMERAMMADDSASFGSILDMRGDIMITVDELNQENREIISHLPDSLREKFSAIILPEKGQAGDSMTLDNPLETNIYDTNKRIAVLLSKIIKLDNEINQKIKGQSQAHRLHVRG
ncbi:hypothetical protein [Aminipila luticellarii]|uniref:FlgN protein n=1 Tax=Aminipila luticellarii TaxID=2507160 RepID=A0A410PST2_9FIRM|nr:hypothetical protein [Aminipila luticellarii]QAT42041.1 hypothetical protein EQM06_01690 [Aminipila luticellarii]